MTIKNDGGLAGSPSIDVSGDAHFSLDPATNFTCGQLVSGVTTWNVLQPGQSCTVSVMFVWGAAPLSVGPLNGLVKAFGAPTGPSHALAGPFTAPVTANITP